MNSHDAASASTLHLLNANTTKVVVIAKFKNIFQVDRAINTRSLSREHTSISREDFSSLISSFAHFYIVLSQNASLFEVERTRVISHRRYSPVNGSSYRHQRFFFFVCAVCAHARARARVCVCVCVCVYVHGYFLEAADLRH